MNRRFILFLFASVFAATGTAHAFAQTAADSLPQVRRKTQHVEKSFKPSEDDTDIELLHKKENQPRPIVSTFPSKRSLSLNRRPSKVSAFRSLLRTIMMKQFQSATRSISTPPSVGVHVYDAHLEIRVGDYTNRADANLAVDGFIEKGYKGAWVVPDRAR